MFTTSAELVKEARWVTSQFDGGDVEVSGPWLDMLANALEAADSTVARHLSLVARMEAERDAAQAQIEKFAAQSEVVVALARRSLAERDAALSVIAAARNLYGKTGGTAEDLAWQMWLALDLAVHKAAK